MLTAALSLMSTEGLTALTMEGIAARAGVGKQTVYRWWTSRADILLEALRENATEPAPLPRTGSLRDDLRIFIQATFSIARERWVMASVLRALIAEAQSDEGLRARFRAEVIESRRTELSAIFEIAILQGDARADFSADVGVDMVFGAMWYRLLVGHLPIDDAFAIVVADSVSRAAMPQPVGPAE